MKDIPLLYFHKCFKGSGHPFHEAIIRIDKELASG